MTPGADLPVVLFVDDDPLILQGLRRMLRNQRGSWAMEFVEGGPNALARLDNGPIDVIVCDMRMPSVDGVAVLTAAATKHPESLRFILSGYAEETMMMRALGPTHQLLSKPVDTSQIVDTIQGALSVRDRLPLPELRALLNKLTSLPIPSEHYAVLMRAIDDPLASAASVGAQIEQDLGLATQLLRLANSAYFTLPKRITRPREAVEMLGIEMVRALLTLSTFYQTDSLDPVWVTGLAERSLRIGAYAKRIAEALKLSSRDCEHAATAGLLCHIGSLVLFSNAKAGFESAVKHIAPPQMSLVKAERGVFGASHADLGAYLASIWGFPMPVVEAIAFHHEPQHSRNSTLSPLTAVHIAQSRALSAPGVGAPSGLRQPCLDEVYLASIGINLDILQERSLCRAG